MFLLGTLFIAAGPASLLALWHLFGYSKMWGVIAITVTCIGGAIQFIAARRMWQQLYSKP